MTNDYEIRRRQEREELYDRRRKYQEEMIKERARVRELFRKRGIPEWQQGMKFDRIVKVEIVVDCKYESTCFVIPEDIDLEKVVRWFINDTKFFSCVVFWEDFPPTTIWYDEGVDRYFDHARYMHKHYPKKED